jgi:hypothetical protein
MPTWDEYLRRIAVPKQLIDDFLEDPNWAAFDPELGYVLSNSSIPWGEAGTRPIETVAFHGARSAFMYAGRRPRINCYGDSFTESNQVGDGETWEEYLAGHFAEPVGNYGVGGHGVYQAYRRLVRTEPTEYGAEVVVLYVWGDDPFRSVLSARWPVIAPWYLYGPQKVGFHAGPWAHIAIDLDSGEYTERESLLPDPKSLYLMTDPEWVRTAFVYDDPARLKMFLADGEYRVEDLDRDRTDRIAEILGVPFDWSDERTQRAGAARLLNRYCQQATNVIIDKAREFTSSRGKRLLVALNFTDGLAFSNRVDEFAGDEPWTDEIILDHLAETGVPVFDMNEIHRAEHAETTLEYLDYMGRYLVDGAGHYSPRGNHLFAYAIKDALLPLLDPAPTPYRDRTDQAPVDFTNYLPYAR